MKNIKILNATRKPDCSSTHTLGNRFIDWLRYYKPSLKCFWVELGSALRGDFFEKYYCWFKTRWSDGQSSYFLPLATLRRSREIVGLHPIESCRFDDFNWLCVSQESSNYKQMPKEISSSALQPCSFPIWKDLPISFNFFAYKSHHVTGLLRLVRT